MRAYRQWMLAVMVAMLAVVSVTSQAVAQEGAPGQVVQDQPGETMEPAQDAPSVAGNSIGAFFGYDLDIEEPMAGADLRFGFDLPDVSPGFGLAINPALSYYFVSGGTFLQIDANILVQFAVDPSVTIYGGLGPAIHHLRVSGFGSDTEVNFNLMVGGASFAIDPSIDLFAQMRLTRISDGFSSTTTASFMGGLKFGF